MPWFWTDDLARCLLAAGVVGDDRVREWLSHPRAVAGTMDDDPVTLGLRLLGGEGGAEPVAGAA